MAKRANSRTRRREPRTDGDATRARIIEAAGPLFAASGFAHTTAKAVAKRARVSLASINYHFEGRDGLYRAVLIEAHQRAINLSDLRDLAGSGLSASQKLKSFIGQLVTQATDRQLGWHMDVLAREILAPSPLIGALIQTAMPPKLAIVMQVISEITDIPPGQPALLRCFLSALTPCTVLLLMARGVPGPLHEVRQMPPEVLTDHLHAFAMAGLERIAREYGRQNS